MENINKRPRHFVCSRRLSSASDITSSSRAHTIQSDNEFNPGKISRCGSRRNVEERSHYFVYSPNRRVHQQFVFSGQKRWRSSSPSHKSQTSQSVCTLSALQNGRFALPEISVTRGRLHVQAGFKRCLLFSPIAQRFQEADTLSLVRESLRIPVSMFWTGTCAKNFYKNSEGAYGITKEIKYQSNYIFGRHDNDGVISRIIVDSQRHSNLPPATLGFCNQFEKISSSSNSEDRILRFDNRFCGDDPIFDRPKIRENNVVVFTSIRKPKTVDFRFNKVDRGDVVHSASSFACKDSISLFATAANTVITKQQKLFPINKVEQKFQGGTVMVNQQLETLQWPVPFTTSTTSSDANRCIQNWMGGNMQGSKNWGSLVKGGTEASYQYTGASGSQISPHNIYKKSKLKISSFSDRQYNSIVIFPIIMGGGGGGTRNHALIQLSKDIWSILLTKEITITAKYLPSLLNVVADQESRMRDSTEWKLLPKVFASICKRWGTPSLDLFASRVSHQIPAYVAWKPDPYSQGTDAFQQDWSGQFLYAFPPFWLLNRVFFFFFFSIQKIINYIMTHLKQN